MPNSVQRRPGDDVVRIRLSGFMSVADRDELEAIAVELLDQGRPVRVIVTLDDFHGWARDARWEDDLDFSFAYADRIEAIAIVGEERWREGALLFVGKGFRRTRIAYFPPGAGSLANAWI